MAEPFLNIDDLTEHLGNLPDWYVQVLEARERNACVVCPEDEIEIELTDFSGSPISGEPWFVFMENTNGSTVSSVNLDVDPFLNGAGQTTPSPLVLNPGAHVLDIAFGGETPTSFFRRVKSRLTGLALVRCWICSKGIPLPFGYMQKTRRNRLICFKRGLQALCAMVAIGLQGRRRSRATAS